MANDMGFTLPFKTAQESTNVFVKQDAEYTEAGKHLFHGTSQQCRLKSGKTDLEQLLPHMQQAQVHGMML